ncbi:hypothetical protein [Amycolatopsis suaedae]|uniref:Tat pathway signal protein n=1 Tax=Amycolatopsis suaedae TaxID=2510978 RepID=A0A4Q7J6X3_9PSEU|nr:hypothetical protein [Amycolatopsis suaedae]RZQ62083.1 hypothetical protein EWH70_21085 [Amycolatopsis suaedae]
MTENTPPGGQPPQEPQQPRQGSMRFQDPSTTTPREPTLAEQRARRQAMAAEQERAVALQEAEKRSKTKRNVLIGSGVAVGLVGVVAAWYVVAKPNDVTAVCTDQSDTIVADDNNCDEDYARSHGGHVSGGWIFIPYGGGYNQYRYNYGGTGVPGQKVSGGSFTRPSGANITTKSGKSVQRGGFGISGKSGTGKSGGS